MYNEYSSGLKLNIVEFHRRRAAGLRKAFRLLSASVGASDRTSIGTSVGVSVGAFDRTSVGTSVGVSGGPSDGGAAEIAPEIGLAQLQLLVLELNQSAVVPYVPLRRVTFLFGTLDDDNSGRGTHQ